MEALRCVTEALELAAWGKNATHLAIYNANCAAYRIALVTLGTGRDAARDALHWALEAKNELVAADAIAHLALIAALGSDAHKAARLGGYADAKYTELGELRESTEMWSHEQLAAALRHQLDRGAIETLSAEGAGWTLEQVIAEALSVQTR